MTNGAQPTTISVPCPRCMGSGKCLRERQSAPAAGVPCTRCEGRPGCKVEVSWRTSGRDNKSHCVFMRGTFVEGICGHSVPLGVLVDRAAGRGCTKCAEKLVELLKLPAADWRLLG